ncbi:hypothetical protein [Paenibacillus piri]|uniref:Uncharacterized protein n=1 Tax=Paenibacillus piri TaxID=2547395 RepID=A0A4V2ZSV3_9BACL|nr:hypothetical protein [Paenibacillus piri]TDF94684.1 hypothetical protein E1757_22225 [Paenibacillus piri]
MNHEQCEHPNQRYHQHSLTCSDCKQPGLDQSLSENDYPALFTEVYLNSDTGFSVIKINNHIDKVTFYRGFDGNTECLGTFHDLQEAIAIQW